MQDGICQNNDDYSFIINKNKTISIDKNGIYNLFIKDIKKLNVTVEIGIRATINMFQYDENKIKLNLNISDKSRIGYYIYSYKSNSKSILINMNKGSYLKVYNMEIGDNTDISYNIKLLGEDCFLDYNFVLYSDKSNENKVSVKVEHLNVNTKAIVKNIGVLNDNAICTFDVSNYIKRGCVGSDAKQKSSILCLNDNCISKINPILLIDEYDVSASHSAIVSGIREEELYYLMSRGIKEDIAKKIMSIGYLMVHAPKHIERYLNNMLEKRIKDERI